MIVPAPPSLLALAPDADGQYSISPVLALAPDLQPYLIIDGEAGLADSGYYLLTSLDEVPVAVAALLQDEADIHAQAATHMGAVLDGTTWRCPDERSAAVAARSEQCAEQAEAVRREPRLALALLTPAARARLTGPPRLGGAAAPLGGQVEGRPQWG